MTNFFKDIISAEQKHLAFLLDPDKVNKDNFDDYLNLITLHQPSLILVGGSQKSNSQTDDLILDLKKHLTQKILLFPGELSQLSGHADALLFLQLLSGRNPKYLIDIHVEAIPLLDQLKLDIIPTTYLLIDGDKTSTVETVSETKTLDKNNYSSIYQYAKAGELFGHKLLYLEAGSGAKTAIPVELVSYLSQKISIPIIVGGGIKSREQVMAYHQAGATIVVVGTAFENKTFR